MTQSATSLNEKWASAMAGESFYYVGVKGSPFATDCTVFGLAADEILALSKRFPNSGSEDRFVVNGVMIKGPPFSIINALAELGYRVICSADLRTNKISGTMNNCDEHTSEHLCCVSGVTFGVQQSLLEIEFERGIWYAAQYGDSDRVQALLKKGISANIEDSAGYQAIHYAARNGHYRVCEMLLENGADVNARTRCGQATALHRAATQGHVNIIELLLRFNADTSLADTDGCTALHRALMQKSVVISTLLIPHTNFASLDNSRNNITELAKVYCSEVLPLILAQQSNDN